MKPLRVKIKRFVADAEIPRYANPGDAGMDLVAVTRTFDEFGNIVYGTGLGFEIPEGYVGLVFPRSSNCKKDLFLTNSVGVIDSGYRGEVTLKFKPTDLRCDKWGRINRQNKSFPYEVGERVGQLIIMPYPTIEFKEVAELSDSARGAHGYGSTGK